MKTYPRVLSIAGSDSSGGAGIQADIKTASALGVYAMTAITAITAQNTMGVTAIEGITPSVVGAQIDAVFNDIIPDATKIGMLFSSEIIAEVLRTLKAHDAKNIVLDPVMISTSGSKLISDNAIDYIINYLIPISTIITPNKHEAELISGIKITSINDVDAVAQKITSMGCRAVLIKGGHFDSSVMTDYLYLNGVLSHTLEDPIVNTPNTHGTGCTLSTAIASYLALGANLTSAVVLAKKFITSALISGSDITIGSGHGSMNHLFSPKKMNIKQI